jgi:3-oxoacyl-[acyl-carrier protein] reductase
MQSIKNLVHRSPHTSGQTSPARNHTPANTIDMSTPLTGKVAIITGGSKGIGRSTALALSKLGANVVINYGRDTAAAEATVKDLGGASRALAVQADAGSMAGVEKLVKETVAHFGKIDILIPNAGVMLMKSVESTTEEDFDRSYNLNVKGPYFLIQKALPHIGEGGRIVLISTSLAGANTVTPNYTLYCSTKGAVEQMTRTIARDLAPRKINVNCIAPGPTSTELFLEGKSEQVLNMIKSLNPQKRLGEPEEIADAITGMCTPQSRWITGQLVRVNGGFV